VTPTPVVAARSGAQVPSTMGGAANMRERLRTTRWGTAQEGRGSGMRRHGRWSWVMIAAALTACGSSAAPPAEQSSAAAPTHASSATSYLSYDAAARTVHVALVAGYSRTVGRNFDGHSKGSLAFIIPAGWSVTVDCSNADPAEFHSCAAVSDASATSPAFAGATTVEPLNGLGFRHSATFTFTPNVPGAYRFACLVGHHEVAGMWDALTITSSGNPSATT
jgi:sulfocyanin SoxE-like protein